MILCVAAIVIVSVVMVSKRNDYPDRMTVSAVGKIYAKADVANITLGVKTEAKKTSAEAVKENSEKMNEIVKELKKLDIEEKDIKTTNYSLRPLYNWTEGKGQVLQGYEVSQNLEIKIRDLDKIGEVISKSAEEGANQVGNVSFTIDDEFELREQARNAAIEKAKEKAKSISKESGIKLGSIKNVIENQYYQPQPYANARMESSVGIGGGGLATPDIQAGQNEISIEVMVIYEVK